MVFQYDADPTALCWIRVPSELAVFQSADADPRSNPQTAVASAQKVGISKFCEVKGGDRKRDKLDAVETQQASGVPNHK
jgi:hypothetical protein